MASAPSVVGRWPKLMSVRTLQQLSRDIQLHLEQWLGSGESMSIFVSGKSGGGKSALVNALVGETVAEEGAEPDPMTAEVTCYSRNVHGVCLHVWDSPGLQDGTVNEGRYLADMNTKGCADADLFLFCINVGDTIKFTLDSSELKALAKLTEAFGTSLWDHAVIALTFANRLGQKNAEVRLAKRRKDEKKLKELFSSKIREWKESLRQMLLKIGVNSVQASRVTIIPTGYRTSPSLPDRPHWLSTFWFSVLHSTKSRAQPALLQMNETRIVESPETVTGAHHLQHCSDQTLIFRSFGGAVGSEYGLENVGSHVGLEVAKIKTINLLERIVLEQYFLERTMKHGTLSEELQQLPVSATLPPLRAESVSAVGILAGEIETSTSPTSPRSECGGYPYD